MPGIKEVFRSLINLGIRSQVEQITDIQELEYLRPLLETLGEEFKVAIDVGAHEGAFTRALAGMGFKVYALEPHSQVYKKLSQLLRDIIHSRRVELLPFAASDHDGIAEMFVGTADTVNTLEAEWTTIAFPEYFIKKRMVEVPVKRLSAMLSEHGLTKVGFVKIDTEGHESKVLRGMFQGNGGFSLPAVIMFEANQRFPERAEECLSILNSNGYKLFDLFIKEGHTILTVARFQGTRLPNEWRPYGHKYFYANIIAYHDGVDREAIPGITRFFRRESLGRPRYVLQQALEIEKTYPVEVHEQWQQARSQLRSFILNEDFGDFLLNPVCRGMFFRVGWSSAQEFELQSLTSSPWGQELLKRTDEPPVGKPEKSPKLNKFSSNMLGMMYYLFRLRGMFGGCWPKRVLEVGGGYGAFSYLFCHEVTDSTYCIVDLPEMLALQHYFFSQAFPEREVRLATPDDMNVKEGETVLIPANLIQQFAFQADLLFSTFAFSEMPYALQMEFEKKNFFDARSLFLTGQLSDEAPNVGWEPHPHVVGTLMNYFTDLRIERFHIGKNYLVEGHRKTGQDV